MSLVAQRDRPWTEVLSELVGVSIIGCIPMHPYFAFMQRTGLYTIEQRTGSSLVDVKKLPATFATYAGVSRGIPIVLRSLKAYLDERHGGRAVDLQCGRITHLTTYERYLTWSEASKLGFPLTQNARYLRISRVIVLDEFLEVRFTSETVWRKRVSHVRKCSTSNVM